MGECLKRHVAIAAAGIGFGGFLGIIVFVVSRSSPYAILMGVEAYKPIAIGFLGGLAVCSMPVVLFYAKDIYRSYSRRLSSLALILGLVLTLVGCLGAFVFDPTVAAVGLPLVNWSIGAICMGLGASFILFALTTTICFLEERGVMLCCAIACAVGSFLAAISASIPSGVSLLCLLIDAIGLVFGFCVHLIIAAKSTRRTYGREGLSSSRTDYRKFLKSIWRPFLGAMVSAFVFGLAWDTSATKVPLNGDWLLSMEKSVGMFMCAVIIIALLFFARRIDVQKVLLNVILPVVLVTFIVRPYFFDATLSPLILAAYGVVREAGFWMFFTVAFVAVVVNALRSNVALCFGAGILVFALCLSAIAGMWCPYILGPYYGYLGAVAYMLYLVATIVYSSVARPAANENPERNEQSFERFLEIRCRDISRKYSLTPRETEVVELLGKGHSYAYIAKSLVVSENTARTHVRNIYRKTGVTSREELLELIHREDVEAVME